MSEETTDPTAALLQSTGARTAVARSLGQAHKDLVAAVEAYRRAWRSARETGWAKTDLTRAGLTDPARLPRLRRPAPDSAPAPAAGRDRGQE